MLGEGVAESERTVRSEIEVWEVGNSMEGYSR